MELGSSYQYKRSGVKRSLVEKRDTFQYVPFIENLTWLLQNNDIYNEVSVPNFNVYVDLMLHE